MARVSLFEILKMVTTKVICKAYLVKMHFYLTVKVVVIFARPESHFLNYSNIGRPIQRFRQHFFLLTSYSPKRVVTKVDSLVCTVGTTRLGE